MARPFAERGRTMKTCLIVDDAGVIRKVARYIIESLRYEVAEAETAQDALEHCKAGMPDVILLDWQLPSMTAHEFLAAMRGLSAERRPFVIYCTTEHDPVDIGRARSAGADTYLMKPFDRLGLEAKFSEIPAAA